MAFQAKDVHILKNFGYQVLTRVAVYGDDVLEITVHMGRYSVTGSAPDCKSGAERLSWFKSNPAHHI